MEHPLVTHRCGSVANLGEGDPHHRHRILQFHREDYRLVVDPARGLFYIQHKKPLGRELVFRPDTVTPEVVFAVQDGRMHVDPVFVRDVDDPLRLVGVASFLDSPRTHVEVKIVHVREDDGAVVLYYLHEPNNHLAPFHHLLLENERRGEEEGWTGSDVYFRASWRLDARLPPLAPEEMGDVEKPKHDADFDPEMPAYRLPKLDDHQAVLRFYATHFVINLPRLSCTTHPHTLPPAAIHGLRDFVFVVETHLYACCGRRPSPIVDIATHSFDARRRMDIIQILRRLHRDDLAPYCIFFQEEEESGHRHRPRSQSPPPSLEDGRIYEVCLARDEDGMVVVSSVVRARPDKLRANSRLVVEQVLRKLGRTVTE